MPNMPYSYSVPRSFESLQSSVIGYLKYGHSIFRSSVEFPFCLQEYFFGLQLFNTGLIEKPAYYFSKYR